MSSTNAQPVLVFLPSAFATVRTYDDFAASLKRHDVRHKVVDMPSVGRREGLPPQTLSDDAAAIVKVVTEQLDQGNEVVLMAHSYAAFPGTQSLKELSRVSRAAKGLKGGVDKIIYLTGVVPPVGLANIELFSGDTPDFLTINDDFLALDPVPSGPITFSDLPLERALELAKGMSPEHSTASFKEKLSYPGYNDVQVHYVLCEEDQLLPLEAQQSTIESVKGFTGKDVVVHKIKAGHAPTSSKPDDVTKIVLDVFAHSI
jgi:pimeloyl-ACP methyl ester carboxylesterase